MSRARNRRHFRSAIDGWLVAVLAFSSAMMVLAFGLLLREPVSVARAVALFLTALGLGLPLWVVLTTGYTVADDTLTIRSGPVRLRYPVSKIASVRASRSPLSSPALSLNRLEIRFHAGQRVLVSPREREAFLEAIGQRLER